MARFLHNGPCHKCGSRDNLATYDDGSKWCWGCEHYEPPTLSPYVTRELKKNHELEEEQVFRVKEEGLTTEFSTATNDWLHKYGIQAEEAIKNGVRSKGQYKTVFLLYPTNSTVESGRNAEVAGPNIQSVIPAACQERNHHPLSKQKYFTQGNINDILPIYYAPNVPVDPDGVHSPDGRRLVLVEDCLSAIKIARQRDAMPCLGSGTSLKNLTRLKLFYGVLDVWLDGNMYHKAQKLALQAQMLGMKARAIYTELDPKCYNDDEIKEILK